MFFKIIYYLLLFNSLKLTELILYFSTTTSPQRSYKFKAQWSN